MRAASSSLRLEAQVVDLPPDQTQRAGGLGQIARGGEQPRRRVLGSAAVSAKKAAASSASPASTAVASPKATCTVGTSAPHGVVVHARQVVVDQRVGVHELHGDRHRQGALGRGAHRLGGGERERRAQALAAREEQVPHGRVQRRGLGVGRRQRGVERALDRRQALEQIGPQIHYSALLGLLERSRHPALALPHQHLDAPLRVRELLRAATGERDAGLEGAQGVLELELALLEPIHDRLELLERGLEGGPIGGPSAAVSAGGVSDLRRAAMRRAMLPAAPGSVNETRGARPFGRAGFRLAAAREPPRTAASISASATRSETRSPGPTSPAPRTIAPSRERRTIA